MRTEHLVARTGVALLAAMIAVSGVVTDEGVECRAMRGDDGVLYTFRDLPDEIEAGDRIEVRGAEMGDSTCQQGVTLRTVRVARPARDGKPERIWE